MKELVEALRPFAGEYSEEEWSGATDDYDIKDLHNLTVGDLRRAHLVLKEE